jgi:hypothetical protein
MIGNRPSDMGNGPRVPLWLLVVLVVIGIIVVVFFTDWVWEGVHF